MALLPPLQPWLLPLLVLGQTDPGVRAGAAAGAVVRLRPRQQGRDGDPDHLLPGRRRAVRRPAAHRAGLARPRAHDGRDARCARCSGCACRRRCRRSARACASRRRSRRSAPWSASGSARRAGLGYLMLHANARLQIELMFAALIVLMAMALALYLTVDRLLIRLMPWAPADAVARCQLNLGGSARCVWSSPAAACALALPAPARGRRSADAAARLVRQPRPCADHRRAGARLLRAMPGSRSRSWRRPIPTIRRSWSRPARPTSRSATSRSCTSRSTRACRSSRIGTLVATPLNSLVVLEDGADRRDRRPRGPQGRLLGRRLRGRAAAGDAGQARPRARRRSSWSTSTSRCRPALLSGQVDAVIGAFRNFELNQLAIEGQPGRAFYPEEEGVPVYDELIFIANRERARRPAPRPLHRRGRARARST